MNLGIIPGLPATLTNNGKLLSYLRQYYNQNGYLPTQYQQNYNPYLQLILAAGSGGYGGYGGYSYPTPSVYNYTPQYYGGAYTGSYGYPYTGGYPTYGNPQCTSQGFVYNPATGTCAAPAANPYIYDPTGAYSNYYNPTGYSYQSATPPNVIGQPMQVGVNAINQAGFTAWLDYQDGISQGPPTDGYNPRRVQINTNGGVISSETIG